LFSQRFGVPVRFIEFMPLCGLGWDREEFKPLTGLRDHLVQAFSGRLAGVDGVAERYVLAEGGELGFIRSMSNPFCGQCSRLRMTATGTIRPCLFSPEGIELRPMLRAGVPDGRLEEAIRVAVWRKPAGHGIDPRHPDRPKAAALIRSVGG
jgi:cyclic pyranopterin phosphate synthase